MTQVKHYPTMAQRKLAKILPPDLYKLGEPLDKKSLHGILGQAAKLYPDKYPEMVKSLNDLGIRVASLDGSSTFSLADLSTPVRAKLRRSNMRQGITAALNTLSREESRTAIRKILAENIEPDIEEIYQDSKAENHPLAIQVDNAGRGNKSSIVSLRGGELAAKDSHGKIIPVLLDRSYSQGLTPGMYRAMQQGARAGVVSAKLCCAGDTLVRMANGKTKRLDNVQPDDWVLGADSRGCVLPVRVKNRWDNGLRNCHTFVFRLGCSSTTISLTATEDHKLLSQIRRDSMGPTWDSDMEIRLRPLSLVTASAESTKGFLHAIRTTGSAFGQHAGLVQQPMYYEANKIVRVDTCGVIETYDLEVDHPDHMYVLANGLIVSNSVASSGYANKTMAQAVHRLVVSKIDDDTSIGRGLPVTTDDDDNDGALLAQDYGPYKRNTVITPKIRKAIARSGHDEILVRSPIASGAPDGGVLARDLGERNFGRLSEIGEFANLAASNAIGESVTQATLNAKHNSAIKPSDVADMDDEEFKLSGFELIDKVLNPSAERRGFAVHSDEDGRIGLMRNAPQGGHFVMIGMKQHYLPVGSKFKYKPGDEVEAGDQLTEGIPDHVSVARHQGIGEGRRRVTEAFSKALKANGQKGNRRNIEILSRGLLDRVKLTEEFGDYIPDDVVPYHRIEAEWQPREDSQTVKVDRSQGKYLEKPVLHYSIGTKLRPSVIKMLQKHSVSDVTVNDNPPPFEPEVVRATDIMQTDPDWMSRQLGGHTVRSFDEAVLRGRSSDTAGTSYIGARAELKSFNRGSNVIKLDAPATNAPYIP